MNRMRAAIGMFAVAPRPGLVSPDYAVFRISSDVNPVYYLHLFKTSIMRSIFRIESKGLGTGSAGFMRLYSDRFGNIKAPLPSLSEQQAIVGYINEATAGVDASLTTVTREIALLREYRTRLIADVVTGKLDVRAAAAALPDAPPDPAPDDEEALDDGEDEGMEEAMEDEA